MENIIMKKSLLIISLILSWIGTAVSSHAQVTNLSTSAYIANISGSAGEVLTFTVDDTSSLDFLNVFLKTHKGKTQLKDIQSAETPFQHGNEQILTRLFPDENYVFTIEVIEDFEGTLEVFPGPFPSFYTEIDDIADYQELSTDWTVGISRQNISDEDRFFHILVTLPAGLDKAVFSWDPGQPGIPEDQGDIFISRSGWANPDDALPFYVSAHENGNDSIVLNYPNAGPVYITIGPKDGNGDNSYDGYLDMFTATAPHQSPITPMANTSTATYQSTPMFYFQRSDNQAYFFTANLDEKDVVLTNLPLLVYQGISHHVISNTTLNSVPVYRFRNLHHTTHFYTADTNEAKRLIFYGYNNYAYEGTAFQVLLTPEAGASPVHRFFQPSTGSHFFTIDEAEKNDLSANSALLNYEGVAWYAYP